MESSRLNAGTLRNKIPWSPTRGVLHLADKAA